MYPIANQITVDEDPCRSFRSWLIKSFMWQNCDGKWSSVAPHNCITDALIPPESVHLQLREQSCMKAMSQHSILASYLEYYLEYTSEWSLCHFCSTRCISICSYQVWCVNGNIKYLGVGSFCISIMMILKTLFFKRRRSCPVRGSSRRLKNKVGLTNV